MENKQKLFLLLYSCFAETFIVMNKDFDMVVMRVIVDFVGLHEESLKKEGTTFVFKIVSSWCLSE